MEDVRLTRIVCPRGTNKLQKGGDPTAGSPTVTLLRLSPHHGFHLRRLPVTAPATSDAPRFGGLTGGVYKAQEHIHRGVADPRLLAIPASRRRVAACDLNWGRIFEIASTSRYRIPLSTVHCSMFVAQGVRAMLT